MYTLNIELLDGAYQPIGIYNDALYARINVGADCVIYKSVDRGASFTQVGVLSGALGKQMGYVSAAGHIYLVASSDSYTTHQMYRSTDEGNTWSMVLDLGTSSFLDHNMTEDDTALYFGEYNGLVTTYPDMHLYKSVDDGESFAPIYTFTSSRVRHVHFVRKDPYTGYIWMGTGDDNSACHIGYSTDGGQTFTWVLQGSQSARVVSVQFSENYVHWAMDYYPGCFFRYHRATKWVEQLNSFESGPGYYSSVFPNGVMLWVFHSPTNATWYLCHDEQLWYQASSWDIYQAGMARINALTSADSAGYCYAVVGNVVQPGGGNIVTGLIRMSVSPAPIDSIQLLAPITEANSNIVVPITAIGFLAGAETDFIPKWSVVSGSANVTPAQSAKKVGVKLAADASATVRCEWAENSAVYTDIAIGYSNTTKTLSRGILKRRYAL